MTAAIFPSIYWCLLGEMCGRQGTWISTHISLYFAARLDEIRVQHGAHDRNGAVHIRRC